MISSLTCAGDMVGVDVGVQHELEVETKLAHKTHVSLGLISHYVGQ